MKKTIKTRQAVTAYNVAKNLKLGKVERDDVFALLRATNALKSSATGYEDFVKDTQERLKPEDFDKIAAKYQAKEELTAKGQAAVEKYNKDVTDCVEAELEKTVEIEFEPLREDGLYALAAANEGLTVEAVALMQEVFC